MYKFTVHTCKPGRNIQSIEVNEKLHLDARGALAYNERKDDEKNCDLPAFSGVWEC